MSRTDKQPRPGFIFFLLGLLLLVVALVSICNGAVHIKVAEIFSAIQHSIHSGDTLSLNERIFMEIRLPRVILCMLVGAALAVGGILMQGLFRNPIVEPGLIGTSSGAAFGAALYFVLGALFKFNAGEWTLPIAACAGGVISTYLVIILAQSKESAWSSIGTLLLIGIAVNALFVSGVGFLSYIARDPQARSITFWSLGTLSGANWHAVLMVSSSTLICLGFSLRYAKELNALMIGEEEARYLGVDVRFLKRTILGINVVMVAVATAFVGIISFVGLVVPHLLRMMQGSDNRPLIINGAVLGGIVLVTADFAARMLLRPAELPIGIVTSFVGVPVFIWLLRRKNYFF